MWTQIICGYNFVALEKSVKTAPKLSPHKFFVFISSKVAKGLNDQNDLKVKLIAEQPLTLKMVLTYNM